MQNASVRKLYFAEKDSILEAQLKFKYRPIIDSEVIQVPLKSGTDLPG